MYVLHPEAAATVVALFGKAVARGPDGQLRMLGVGDRVSEDEVVLTAQASDVQLAAAPAPRLLAALSTASPKLIALPDDEPPPTARTGLSDVVIASPVLPPAQRLAALSTALPKLLGSPASAPEPVSTPAEAGGSSSLQAAFRIDGVTLSGSSDPTLAAASAVTSGSDLAARSLARPSGSVDRLAPQAESARQLSTLEDTGVAISLGGRDPDGRIAQVFIVKVPTGGLLYRADGEPIADRSGLTPDEARQLVFVPAPHFNGDPGPLQYMVQDASGKLSAVASVAISVAPVNDAPVPGTTPTGPDLVAAPDADPRHLPGTPDYRWTTAADTPVFGQVRATDVDLDPLSFAATATPSHGNVLVAADGSFVYTPDAGWSGADRFVVTVDDGRGGRASSTVFIEVAAPGATPAAAVTDSQAAAAVPQAEALSLGLPVANPLGFDEIFGRAHAERAATHQVQPDSDVEADVLQLSALLVGHLPVLAPAGPVPERLDLGLDWGLRANGFDWLKNPAGQNPV